MILIGMGAKLNSLWGSPPQSMARALEKIRQSGIRIISQSPLVTSEALGGGGQKKYHNAVIEIASHLPPEALLKRLHAIERMAGRRRSVRWRSRGLDLDILDWNGVIRGRVFEGGRGGGYLPLVLPHPGIASRPFVLLPLSHIAPRWHHPRTGLGALQMLRVLPATAQGKILSR